MVSENASSLTLQPMSVIRAVALREVWLHEAHNFTPWLLSNGEQLGDALGLAITLEAAEHTVGGYSLDLLGRDETHGCRLIIENQIEVTDHAHLGQLVTYAAGTDAKTVIWVAATFRDEHREAISWLNRVSSEEVRFFAVEVSCVRIGDSPVAARFDVVVQPSDWQKRVRADADSKQVSSRMALYREFWEQFVKRVRLERPTWTRWTQGMPQNWLDFAVGLEKAAFNHAFRTEGLVHGIWIQNPSEERGEATYRMLQTQQAALEAAYGRALTWDPKPGRKAFSVFDVYPEPAAVENRDAWDDYIAWLIDSGDRFRRALRAIDTADGAQAISEV